MGNATVHIKPGQRKPPASVLNGTVLNMETAKLYKSLKGKGGEHIMAYSKIIVHAGVFHADDAFCVAMAEMLWPGIQVERVFRVPDDIGSDVLVADIGGGEFDHHQSNAPIREDGFPHCAASLMWARFGKELVSAMAPAASEKQVQSIVMRVDAELFRSVAANDNGCKKTHSSNGLLGASDVMSVNGLVSQFNPAWNSTTSMDDAFKEATAFVKGILKRMLERKVANAEGEELLETACKQAQKSKFPQIIKLPTYIPWQSHICRHAPNALVVIFPALRGGYNVQLVPVSANSFETRTQMPTEWYGKSGLEAEKLVAGMSFCHRGGFLAAFDSEENAFEAAKFIVANSR